MIRIGIDIGSTTIKSVAINESGDTLFSSYERHNAKGKETLLSTLNKLKREIGDAEVSLSMTGSIGMGVAEKCSLPFIQEVVAATKAVHVRYPEVRSLIDIGGEDAKVVFFRDGNATDLRMNGNCAGGTGAFIDQMAILLNITTDDLNALAEKATTIHPIASRCGVFSKTDVQNLMAKNVNKEDIAASVFHAVAVQVVVALARGSDIEPPILMCGGPLTFLPVLHKAFADYLHIPLSSFIVPPESHLIPALGAALSADGKGATLSSVISIVEKGLCHTAPSDKVLPTIFKDKAEIEAWQQRISHDNTIEAQLKTGRIEATLGIDSGSTTTKIVVMDSEGHIIYNYYHNNDGNPIATAQQGLKELDRRCKAVGTDLRINGSCSTGYGEELLKAALGLDHGIIETIAHYMAARQLNDKVSFIIDIGGQDMKAVFVNEGVINRMELNEACSSGCGSFIETFAKSLGYTVAEFARMATEAKHPYDLGTRCTVFMNSKVKQALREGASIADIAAGLSYSVVKNCLYKVLRLKDPKEFGDNIVVQGGTMRNDSVVRVFEKLTDREVKRSSHPELMGAMGCALYARKYGGSTVTVNDMLQCSDFTTRQTQCKGCTNQCLVTIYRFNSGHRYFSGNRCEKVFNNSERQIECGRNVYSEKLRLLFDRTTTVKKPLLTIGIPRCLNEYEDYPFWHALFTECGIGVKLSAPSSFVHYEHCAKQVMSDNICFPAKLVHSHVDDLVMRGVDRIFMPYVVYEKQDGGQNSFNCPIVSGYADVVKSIDCGDIPIDTPAITFKDSRLLYRQCRKYLCGLGIDAKLVKLAFRKAVEAMEKYEKEIATLNVETLEHGRANGRLTIMLAGRPYHADPLVQHKLSDIIASMGADVLTEDIVRGKDTPTDGVNFVAQWAYATRILKAAEWAATQDDVQFMQMTSFGCGPDAFLTDETRTLLKRYGKTLTLLKIDDISNIGSIKLRVRSCIDSIRLTSRHTAVSNPKPFMQTPPFGKKDRRRTILIPFFTPFISPLLPPIVHLVGYDAHNLPVSDSASSEWGLKYANNEVCYPATLIVGDIVKAFKSGKYKPNDTAVIISQTGGQCRASNYISLIKKALTESGYGNVPVISLASGSGIDNDQPGFKIDWMKILPTVVVALIFSDCMAKLYYASVVREQRQGQAKTLLDRYMDAAKDCILSNSPKALWHTLEDAVMAFDSICTESDAPKIGIVGEIFLKFNPFAQKSVTQWLVEQGLEVVPPMLTDFFLQSFVNTTVNQDGLLCRKTMPNYLIRWIHTLVWRKIDKANRLCGRFRYFVPFENIYAKADEASHVISLYAQFGEGWLLPGEVMSLARQGVTHVVSMQPFGCIANHIVSKGIEKRIKILCPQVSMLSLDFDSGVSDVNVRNRILLFIDNIKKQTNGERQNK